MKIKKQKDTGLLIVRSLVGVLIIFHGLGNLLSGYTFIGGVMENSGLPEFFAYGAFIGELVAPIFIIVGYRARIASLILAFTMLVAIILVHSTDIFALNQFGGWAIELQMFFLLGAMAIFFSGAGDHALSKNNDWD